MRAAKNSTTHFIKALFSIFFSLPAVIVALEVRFGPSLTVYPEWFQNYYLPIIAALCVLTIPLWYTVFSIKKTLPFALVFVFTHLALFFISIALALTVHRDFFTSAFQTIMSIPAAYLIHAGSSPTIKLTGSIKRVMANTGLILAIFYTQWVLMMGYAISTRAEPRPVESIIYNIFNLCLVFILLGSSRYLHMTSYKTVEIGEDIIKIDGKDLTEMAGHKKTLILHAFSRAEERNLKCKEIQKIISGESFNTTDDCPDCDSENKKAAQCPKYRTTYNSILELKKLLEFLETGTITGGTNRKNILENGWQLVLFENVRLQTKK